MKKPILIVALIFFYQIIQAQNAIIATGGNATGSGGTASYSVGQIVYKSATGANGSVNEGLQQPFEISTLGADNFPNIVLEMSVYPNPTINFVTLKISDFSSENLSYQLINISGKQISERKISTTETQLQLDYLNASIYLLNVIENNETIKTFKIIKN